jgi:hypothetical protein
MRPMMAASLGCLKNAGLMRSMLCYLRPMPKPSPKLDPATDAVLRRMLATPPQPKVAVKKKAMALYTVDLEGHCTQQLVALPLA